ncbi:hypothetical protein M0R45_023988 [Rubus argutus]|uniref:Uncharacterized protein n=1 Tax=Rubus argutus TaxID=59490 RepID=A0AAW1WTY5_RUBAR
MPCTHHNQLQTQHRRALRLLLGLSSSVVPLAVAVQPAPFTQATVPFSPVRTPPLLPLRFLARALLPLPCSAIHSPRRVQPSRFAVVSSSRRCHQSVQPRVAPAFTAPLSLPHNPTSLTRSSLPLSSCHCSSLARDATDAPCCSRTE